ncbi:MAG: glycosyltransferase [Pseudomonadota bacterium]|nr:glycosyltransferase [Pseudomonadota bacterium]
MNFSLAIVTFNRAKELSLCLQSLAEQSIGDEHFEIIVVDNGSIDNTRSVVQNCSSAFKNIIYLFDSRPGQLVGWHRALFASKGQILCFIDDDVRPSCRWLEALADAYSHPQVGMVTGPIKPKYDKAPPEWLDQMSLGSPGRQTLPYLSLIDFGGQTLDIPGNFVWGDNFSIRRELLMEVGGFHPCAMPASLRHFYGDGEIVVGREVSKSSYRILYQPEALVEHHIPAFRFLPSAIKAKFFSSGTARSFQTLREIGDAFPTPSKEEIEEITLRYFVDASKVPKEVFFAVRTGLEEGISTHLSKFKTDQYFRDWVLRPDYLDLEDSYKHQELKSYVSELNSVDWRDE